MDNTNKASFSPEEGIREVCGRVSELNDRLVQTEGILFAFLKELGYSPCQDLVRTGNYHEPIIYVPSVKKT